MAPDPYEILGILRSASDAEVRSAYRRRALASHPDKPGGEAARFRSVVEAFAQGGRACVSKRVYPDPQAVARGEVQTRLLNLGSAPAHFEEAAAFVMRKARGHGADALRRAARPL